MRKKILYILAIAPILLKAQNVKLLVGEQLHEIKKEQTQTEVKPGWKIVDIQLKSKVVKYFWGKHAQQLTDDQKPTFIIKPENEECLVDYAIIRLRQRKQYRLLTSPMLFENDYIRLEPKHFKIETIEDMAFKCIPINELKKGEYIIINIAQKPIGELKDYIAYPFRVP